MAGHFSAGTFGYVTKHQVRIFRKPWPTESGYFNVLLEIDEDAFEHLRANNWMSTLGLHVVRWGAPNCAPDVDTKALAKKMVADNAQTAASYPAPSNQDTQNQHPTNTFQHSQPDPTPSQQQHLPRSSKRPREPPVRRERQEQTSHRQVG